LELSVLLVVSMTKMMVDGGDKMRMITLNLKLRQWGDFRLI
jgi:hypothetical protein